MQEDNSELTETAILYNAARSGDSSHLVQLLIRNINIDINQFVVRPHGGP